MRLLRLIAASVLLLAAGAAAQSWNDLRVRFGLSPITNFVRMPRTAAEALRSGFRKETGCNGAANKFLGQRFVKNDGDRSIMLLFDINGIIAGIQTQVPKSTGYPTAQHKRFHDMWVEEADANVLTAYFVEPSVICTSGRTEAQLQQQGTGTGLFMQRGSAVSSSGASVLRIPTREANIGSTSWTNGKCFMFMGQHYWYNLRRTMNCDDFMPYFLLYNDGKLDGFGFAMAANFKGEYYEHPTVSVAGQFFPFVPDCMHAAGFPQTLTTAHVYFYRRPWTRLCL